VLLGRRAGGLAMLTARLTGAGVVVRAIYMTGGSNSIVQLAQVTTNVARARSVLEE